MSIKLRLALLLGLLLLVFVFCLFALRTLEQRQLAESVASARRDDAALLGNWLDLRAASLRRLTDDAAAWPQLAAYAEDKQRPPEWARRALDPLLSDYGIDALWLIRGDGTPIHVARRSGLPDLAAPIPAGGLAELVAPESRERAYFFDAPAGPLEVRGVLLATSDPVWLFAARLWDPDYLERLGDLTESTISFVPASAAGIAESLAHAPLGRDAIAPIAVLRPLPGWTGEPLRYLQLLKPAPDISFRLQSDRLKTRVFLLFGLCLIGSLALSLHRWVLRPLGWITESLARQDPAPIRPLLAERTELTRVARLIVSSFEHREELSREIGERRNAEQELQRTLEERARLGRNLHDGVIQSIYAAGLGLAAARKKIVHDAAASERHLAQVADVLNDTIRDVRDFITGLEPKTLHDDGFTPTIKRLFDTLNASGTAHAEFALDDALSERFPTSYRTEIILLLREALSNALRHGRATQVTIRFALDPTDPAAARLEIADNGTGFDPATVKRGRGLDNLVARAASRGAQATLDSAPGLGTRLIFVLPLPVVDDEEPAEPDPTAD